MDITHVLCFRDPQKAEDKANQFLLQNYKVKMIRETDIVLCDDFSGPPKASYSAGEFDWTVVIASEKPITGPGGEE